MNEKPRQTNDIAVNILPLSRGGRPGQGVGGPAWARRARVRGGVRWGGSAAVGGLTPCPPQEKMGEWAVSP